MDEAGRGPLAGPVVVAAVILDRCRPIVGLADSKALDPEVRAALAEEIVRCATVSLVQVGPQRIDLMNIRGATLWGMAQAVRGLCVPVDMALIDGRDVPPGLGAKGRALVKGDARSASVAAASIVAKVARDRIMERLARSEPRYGFERNKGYPTPEHREALARHGPTCHHRMSFAPVRLAGEARPAEAGGRAGERPVTVLEQAAPA